MDKGRILTERQKAAIRHHNGLTKNGQLVKIHKDSKTVHIYQDGTVLIHVKSSETLHSSVARKPKIFEYYVLILKNGKEYQIPPDGISGVNHTNS